MATATNTSTITATTTIVYFILLKYCGILYIWIQFKHTHIQYISCTLLFSYVVHIIYIQYIWFDALPRFENIYKWPHIFVFWCWWTLLITTLRQIEMRLRWWFHFIISHFTVTPLVLDLVDDFATCSLIHLFIHSIHVRMRELQNNAIESIYSYLWLYLFI